MEKSSETTEKRFAFGRNWQRYLKTVGNREIQAAKRSLEPLLDGIDPSKSSFLDVGCGSGLFSLAAAQLGFRKVVSFDFDENSVRATERIRREYHAKSSSWEVHQGSVLDQNFMNGLGTFTCVYSWGVLHHTGSMWKALDNTLSVVEAGGHLYIALYNDQGWISEFWKKVKYAYVNSPPSARAIMLLFYWLYFGAGLALADILRLRNPLRRYSGDRRGMKFFYDVIDWVGGYPFEVAKPTEVVRRVEEKGFRLLWSKQVGRRHGCNEFVFERNF